MNIDEVVKRADDVVRRLWDERGNTRGSPKWASGIIATAIRDNIVDEVNRTTRESLARWRDLHKAKWGKAISREKWLNNIVEECAELIQAVQHYKRKRVPFSKVRIEMADVSICSDALVAIEDGNGPPIMEDIARIAQYQVDVLEGTIPQIHNDGEITPPNPVGQDLPERLITSEDFKQILACCSYSGARIHRSEDGLYWDFYAPEHRPTWSAEAVDGITTRMPANLQVSFHSYGVEVPDSATEH